jgi:hypothetical protein
VSYSRAVSHPNSEAATTSNPIGRIVAFAVALVIVAGLIVAGVIARNTYFRPADLALEDSFAGYERVDVSENTELERYGSIWRATEDDKPDLKNMYAKSGLDIGGLVYLAGRSKFILDPAALVNEGFDDWKDEITFTDSVESYGDRSLFVRCAIGTPSVKRDQSRVPAVFCAWADQGGYMVGIFDMVDLTAATAAFADIRTTINK